MLSAKHIGTTAYCRAIVLVIQWKVLKGGHCNACVSNGDSREPLADYDEGIRDRSGLTSDLEVIESSGH